MNTKANTWATLGAAFSLLTTNAAFAADSAAPDSGNTAWVIVSSALVLFMTLPGLALFYGGLVRAKNLLSVLMHCFLICCVVSLIWAVVGYSLAFGPADNGLISGFQKLFLADMGSRKSATGIPENVFMLFQMTFAIITPALIIGAFPERVSFPYVILFTIIWIMIVYVPVAHWVWGDGWLAARGTIDFAGGIVVHTTAGISALVAAILIGPRKGFPHTIMPPHSPGLTIAGAGMLWVGWFGFNGGSALAADASAAAAIIATHLSASAGALTWIIVERFRVGKATTVGVVTGAVAGLATVTPASGFVGPMGAIALGGLAGVVCLYATVIVKQHFRIDDSLDVFAVHGIGGMLGSILVAVFALPELGGNGLAEGMTAMSQLGAQALGVGVVALWSGVATFLISRLIGAFTPLRVDAEDEHDGLDLAVHGERAYEHN